MPLTITKRQRCIGFARRRTGRGGRVIFDRCSTNIDEWWSSFDYTVFDNDPTSIQQRPYTNEEATSVKVKADTESLSNSIVVDLIKNRKNSIDNVSRTRAPLECGDSDIVIRNEQNSINVKKEKLDDYDLAGSHSSNILSSLITSSSVFDRNLSENIPSSSSIERNGNVTDVKIEIPSETIQIDRLKSPVTVKTDEDLYSDFLNEIRRDWLHFRPKTPDLHDENSNELIEESSPFTETTSLTVEIQRLGEQPPSCMLTDAQDNIFHTSPFTFDDLNVDEPPTIHDSSSSILENNLSGESLPELSFSLENEDNEKLLENILQECQFDDLKSFNSNANFWNGLLEDDVIDDPKKTSFERIASDLLPIGDDRMKRGKRKLPHRQQRVGSSMISISSIPETPFFRKEKPSEQQDQSNTPKTTSPLPIADDVNVTTITNRAPEIILSSQIKEEPVDDEIVPIIYKQQSTPQVTQTPQLAIVKTENINITNTVPMQQKAFILQQQPTQLHSSTPIIQQVTQVPNSGEGTIILSAATTPLRKHTNGPTEKSSKYFRIILLCYHGV